MGSRSKWVNHEPGATDTGQVPVVFAHLPLGLGLARCVGTPKSSSIIGEVQLLGPEELEELARSLAEPTGSVIVTSAGRIPDLLLDVVDETFGSTPLGREEFAAHFGSADAALVHKAFRLSGGWPEAVSLRDDGCRPTVALVRFVRGLSRRRPILLRVAELVACDDQPVPPEVLGEAVGAAQAEAEEILAELETFGLLSVKDGLVQLAVPIAAGELLPTEVARRRARRILSDAWLSRDPVWAATIDAQPGAQLDDGTRAGLVAALRTAEANRDFIAWERLSETLARLSETEERVIGLLSSARLCLLRGRQAEAARSVGLAVSEGCCPEEAETTSHVVALMGFESGNVLFANHPTPLKSLLPSIAAGSRNELSLLVSEGTLHVRSGTDGRNLESLRGPADLLMDGLRHDYTVLYQLTQDRSLGMNCFGYVVDIYLRCLDGRFGEARDLLVATAGEQFDRIEGRLLQLAALLVASGTDVGQARQLLAAVSPIPPGALGSPLAAAIRARAELVVGRTSEAWSLLSYAWDFVLDHGLSGLEHGLVGEAVSIAYWSGNIERLPLPASPDLVPLVQSLASGEADAAQHALESAGPSPYLQALMMCLVADAHQRRGDDETARVLLQRAATTFSALGAPVDLARAQVQARRGGIFSRESASTSTDGGQESEQRLLELVGLGLSNAEIAAELHLSLSTVKRKISRLLLDHSLTNRRQLGELVRAQGRRPE